jgi:hypothetical protein
VYSVLFSGVSIELVQSAKELLTLASLLSALP